MKWLDTVFDKIETVDSKQFNLYIIFFLGIFIALGGLFGWYYYSAIWDLQRKLRNVNDIREQVQDIRQKAQHVSNQRREVNTMLAEDADFKIAGYFEQTVTKLGLADKKRSEETSQTDRDDAYRESELTATFSDMNMKDITELLFELEQKKRIYVKKIEISNTKKRQNLDFMCTIATLLLKD